jgi:protein-S-isoprenylcysteine O-methyltransferase Ste14
MARASRPPLLRVIVQLVVFVILTPLSPLIISGRWDWLAAWFVALVTILGFVVSRYLASRRNPGLIAERGRMLQHEDTEPFDRVLAPLVGLGGILVFVAAGLDARFNWPLEADPLLVSISAVLFIASFVLGSWALIRNPFFSGVVRIQTERGHRVVASGPYRWIRHPGYAGGLLTYLTIPVVLASTWALVPAILLCIALVIRTALEDKTLHARLDGYPDYAHAVRYRLLPGIW